MHSIVGISRNPPPQPEAFRKSIHMTVSDIHPGVSPGMIAAKGSAYPPASFLDP